jgi:hypothetical protein
MQKMEPSDSSIGEQHSFQSGCWAPPGIGRVACFTGEAVPQAPSSWVCPAESCVVSQCDCAPPVKPQKKQHKHATPQSCTVELDNTQTWK